MDSDPPSIDDENAERALRDTPFASKAGRGTSRVASEIERQRKRQQYLPTGSSASGLRPGMPQPGRPRDIVPEKQRIKARTTHLGKLEQRVEDHLAHMPAFAGNIGGITRLRWLVGMQMLAILVLLGMAIFAGIRLSEHSVYASLTQPRPVVTFDANGNLVASGHAATATVVRPISAMPMPTYTRQAILGWASTTATAIMNFGFHNAGSRISAQKSNFTDHGWNAFITALTDAQLMERIMANEQVITAAPVGAPVILKVTDLPDGTRQWLVQLPFMVTVLSGKKTDATRNTLTLSIVQVSPEQNLTGLAIDNWLAK